MKSVNAIPKLFLFKSAPESRDRGRSKTTFWGKYTKDPDSIDEHKSVVSPLQGALLYEPFKNRELFSWVMSCCPLFTRGAIPSVGLASCLRACGHWEVYVFLNYRIWSSPHQLTSCDSVAEITLDANLTAGITATDIPYHRRGFCFTLISYLIMLTCWKPSLPQQVNPLWRVIGKKI